MSLKFIEITVGWRTRKSVASLVLLSSTIVLFGLAAAQNVPPSTRPQLSVTIRPERDGSSKFTDVEVELEIGVGDTESKQPFALYIPVEFAGIKHVADRIENLEARTKDGPVTLDRHDDPPDAGGSLFWRHWVMAEHPVGSLFVRYRARLGEARPWAGPPFDLRQNGSGLSGAGFGFLVLPESKGTFDIRLKWDLRDMPPGSRGISNLGLGDVQYDGPVESLFECFYMTGPFGTYPQHFESNLFRSAWLGALPFDPQVEMKWAQTAYLSERQFFAETGSVPFYFFMRAGKDNTSYGGAALSNSFLLFLPESLDDTDGPDRLGLVIAHEMVHHFVGTLDSPEGIEGSWYSEGLAEYYSRLVTFRTGLILPRVFTDAVNQSAVLYFTNPLRNLPNEKIAEGFWRDKNAQGVPYQRGFFYFVDVNHKLLMASKGKVSVDTIVLSLLNRRSRGDRLTPQNWLDEIEKVLGPAGRQEFESVIVHGDTVLAASDAFGPCFDRRSVMMPMFELGFDQHATWDSSPPVVHGVVSGSAAQRAGLRDGDKILSMSPSEVERLRSSLSMRIQLKIERGRDTLEIEYLPRSSQSVEGYQWVHNLGVPDEKCAM